jgi:CRISPR/Cas system-associated exonuclease Cas4 (RecB family)
MTDFEENPYYAETDGTNNKSNEIDNKTNNKTDDKTNNKTNDKTNNKTNDKTNDKTNNKTNDKTNDKTINKTNNKTNKNASVFVFEVRQWMTCPRQLFFKNRQQLKQEENNNDHGSVLYKTDPVRYFEKEIIQDVCFELPALVLESGDKNDNDFINKAKLKNKIENVIEESKNCRLILEQTSAEKISDVEKILMRDKAQDIEKIMAREKKQDAEKKQDGEKKRDDKKIKELEDAALKTKQYADDLIDHVSQTIQTHGFGILESAADPYYEEKLFHFSKIDLYGSPKKVIVAGEKLMPYFIRTSLPPKNGVWESERITAAAYTMILENEFGKTAVSENAVVDYLGDFRVIRIRYADKKKVFRAVRKIKDIKNGQMPSEKNIRLCEKCMFKEACRPKAKTLFERIFGGKR